MVCARGLGGWAAWGGAEACARAHVGEVGDIDNINTWLLTNNIASAKVFEDYITAIAFYKWQSSLTPMRPDGKPNRPLTAFTVVFENV